MQRVHVSPSLGNRRVDAVTPEDVDRLARAMLERGLAPKTVRNVMTFLHSVFALAVENGWARGNPVLRAARPRRRRDGDADPDLQFLTLSELDAVIAVIPDRDVDRDALGPLLRLVILAAASSGLRQSELRGLQWKHVDWRAQTIRVRNAWVRHEHSGEGKSDLSTRRSVPLTDRLAAELKRWRLRTVFSDEDDLVFAHPELGVPLDRTKVTRRFQAACEEAGVRAIRFHDLRHTFASTLAAAGVPLRTIQMRPPRALRPRMHRPRQRGAAESAGDARQVLQDVPLTSSTSSWRTFLSLLKDDCAGSVSEAQRLGCESPRTSSPDGP
jgi:integrase